MMTINDEEEPRSYEWQLGGDIDCESCGMSNNLVHFYPSIPSKGDTWSFFYTVGCFGGKETNGDSEYWSVELSHMLEWLKDRFPLWGNEEEAEIMALVTGEEK
jgi:hypothetical protein